MLSVPLGMRQVISQHHDDAQSGRASVLSDTVLRAWHVLAHLISTAARFTGNRGKGRVGNHFLWGTD